MKLTAHIRLNPNPEQHTALSATLEQANALCNAISEAAWQARVFRRLPLQKLVYHDVRTSFRLGAQMTIHCIAKVTDAYKADRSVPRTFQPHGAIAYDDRNLSWYTDRQAVSIWTVHGRQFISFSAGPHQTMLLAHRQGESDLVYHRDIFYLFVACDVPEPDERAIDGVLGVDLGIVNMATDSDGETHTGTIIEHKCQWYAKRRTALQQVRTRSAKRRLRQLRGQQRRFQQDINHCLSKRLVAKAERTNRGIALEDLTHIRARTRAKGAQQRARHSNWAFGQLRQFISYKARRAGGPVYLIDPKHTSQRCSACGHTERRNRRSQAEFCCVVCGHASPADYNAAVNIERAARQTAYGVQPSG